MDATHYEKIADKLMQFRGKIPKENTLSQPNAQMLVDELRWKVDALLSFIDHVASHDEEGWIR